MLTYVSVDRAEHRAAVPQGDQDRGPAARRDTEERDAGRHPQPGQDILTDSPLQCIVGAQCHSVKHHLTTLNYFCKLLCIKCIFSLLD